MSQSLSKNSIPVGVVGLRGYSGVELARLLLNHPYAKVEWCFASDQGLEVFDYLPEEEARQLKVAPIQALEEKCKELRVVFLATPAEVSLDLAPKILQAGCHVVDLSGAFRLLGGSEEHSKSLYKKWYGFEHPLPELLKKAEYGLLPWVTGKDLPSAGPRLIANPGCYATSILLALLPLVKCGVIDLSNVVIDAKSGASGAGRKAAENLLFTEVEGECLPYKIGKHQHLPEITQAIEDFTNVKLNPAMVTHLLPIRRGILSSIYAKLSDGKSAADVASAFRQAYEGAALIEWKELAPSDGRKNQFSLSMKRVVGTCHAHLLFKVEGDQLYIFSMIDNLLKGASGQAVENFNRVMDLPAEMGLKEVKGVL